MLLIIFNQGGGAPAPPSAPTGLAAAVGDGHVVLTWNAASGALTYNVYRGTTSGGETLLVSGIVPTTYDDTGLTNGVTYYYKVSAVNGSGESGLSSEVSATLAVPIPPAPSTVDDGWSNWEPQPYTSRQIYAIAQPRIAREFARAWPATATGEIPAIVAARIVREESTALPVSASGSASVTVGTARSADQLHGASAGAGVLIMPLSPVEVRLIAEQQRMILAGEL